MAIEKEDYTALITSQYQNSTKFLAWLSYLFQTMQDNATLLEGMDNDFDLDNAVGPQLDVVGEIVGLKRRLSVPVYQSEVGFTWDDEDLGWNVGIWVDGQTDTLLDLPDDVYRQAIKIKIAANSWDGSISHAYSIFQALFTDDSITVAIQNNLNMTMDFIMMGESSLLAMETLFTREYISFRPAGVDCTYHINATAYPYFMWDIETEGLFGGWGEGLWSNEDYLITQGLLPGLEITAEDGYSLTTEDGEILITEVL